MRTMATNNLLLAAIDMLLQACDILYACLRMCFCVDVRVYVYVCLFVCVCARVRMCVCGCAYVCACVHACVCVCACMRNACTISLCCVVTLDPVSYVLLGPRDRNK